MASAKSNTSLNAGDAGVDDKMLTLVDVSDIFYFFLLGGGEGGVRGAGRVGGDFFNGKSQEGVGSPGWVGRGGRVPGGCLRGIGGGGG